MRLPYLVILMMPLASCTFPSKKQAATPPPPKPAVVQPAAPEPPLSVPQTAVVLPSQQEFNPDSIPKAVAPAQDIPAPEKAEAAPPPRPARRAVVAGPPKADAEPEAETPATPAPAAPAPEQAPIQPILTPEEQNRIKNLIDGRKREVNDRLGRATRGHLSAHDQSLIDRIHSFLAQCDQAAQRGDYSQADALSERAEVLAKELQLE